MYWIIEHLAIATILTVLFAIVLVLAIFFGVQRIFNHEARPQLGSVIASLVVAVLFSVVLNNWYALKRDRDNRLRALRDQHFSQLKPVLRAEATKIQQLTARISKEGHASAVTRAEGGRETLMAMLWPDIMSQDLQNHFPEYDKRKRSLLSEIETQDQEFRDALSIAEERITFTAGLAPYWKEVAAMSFVGMCIGYGNGMKLNITDGGYSFEYLGSTSSASGGPPPPRPSPDQVASFRAFQSLKPNAELSSHCEHLKRHAETIQNSGEALTKQAMLLSEGTILHGICDFIKSSSLTD